MDTTEKTKEDEDIIHEITDICVDLIKDNDKIQGKLKKEEIEITGKEVQDSSSSSSSDEEKEDKTEEEELDRKVDITEDIGVLSEGLEVENPEKDEPKENEILQKVKEEVQILKNENDELKVLLKEKEDIIEEKDIRIRELETLLEDKKKNESVHSEQSPPSLPPPPHRKMSNAKRVNIESPSKRLITYFMKTAKCLKKPETHKHSPRRREKTAERSLGRFKMADLNEGLETISSVKKKLETNLRESEDIENFSKAKNHHEKLRELHHLESKMFEKKIQIFQKEQFKGLDEEHEQGKEKLKLRYHKLEEKYEMDSNQAISELQRRQIQEYNTKVRELKKEAMSKPVKYSKRLKQLQRQMKMLVERKKYVEADGLRQELKPLENKEIKQFYEELDRIAGLKSKKLKRTHEDEIRSLRSRIQEGGESLKREYQKELELMIKSHNNHKRALEQNHKKIFSEYVTTIKTQMSVIKRHYDKNMIDFNKIDLNHLMDTSVDYKNTRIMKMKSKKKNSPFSVKSKKKKKKMKKTKKNKKKKKKNAKKRVSSSPLAPLDMMMMKEILKLPNNDGDDEKVKGEEDDEKSYVDDDDKEEQREQDEGEDEKDEKESSPPPQQNEEEEEEELSVNRELFNKQQQQEDDDDDKKMKGKVDEGSATKVVKRNKRRRKKNVVVGSSGVTTTAYRRKVPKKIIIKKDKQFGTPKRMLKRGRRRRRQRSSKRKVSLSTLSYDQYVRSKEYSI